MTATRSRLLFSRTQRLTSSSSRRIPLSNNLRHAREASLGKDQEANCSFIRSTRLRRRTSALNAVDSPRLFSTVVPGSEAIPKESRQSLSEIFDEFNVSDAAEKSASDASGAVSIQKFDPRSLPYLSSPQELDSLVLEIESISTLTSIEVASWIHPLMVATSNLKSAHGAELTERLLATCLEKIQAPESFQELTAEEIRLLPYPNQQMYNLAITAWTNADTEKGVGAQRATQLLQLMVGEYNREQQWIEQTNESRTEEERIRIRSPRPDLINYSSVLNAWTKINNKAAPFRCHELLEQMERLSGVSEALSEKAADEHKPGEYLLYLTPDTTCYNTVMKSWAHTSDPQAVSRIRSILRRMQNLYKQTGDNRFQPDTMSFNMLIMAYGKVGKQKRRKNSSQKMPPSFDAALAAEDVLRDMYQIYRASDPEGLFTMEDGSNLVKPNLKSYNGVIHALSNSGSRDAPFRAESILLALLGKIPKENCYIPILDGIVPDIVTFNSVINTWAKSRAREAGQRAERLLQLMGSDDSVNVQPDTITFNSVMNAWSSSGVPETGTRVQALLEEMIDVGGSVTPNGISFSTAILACSRSKTKDSALRAEVLLERMLSLSNKAEFGLSIETISACYNGVLLAWAWKSGTSIKFEGKYPAERAESILEQMVATVNVRSLTWYCNVVLDAWSRHISLSSNVDGENIPNKVEKSRSLLLWMVGEEEAGAWPTPNPDLQRTVPNTSSYNFVIEACASHLDSTGGDKKSMSVPMEMFHRLVESPSCDPDERTYMLLFKMCAKLQSSPDFNTTHLPERLFRNCCDAGMLGNDTLAAATKCLAQNSLEKLMKISSRSFGFPNHVRYFPSDWSRNVNQPRRTR